VVNGAATTWPLRVLDQACASKKASCSLQLTGEADGDVRLLLKQVDLRQRCCSRCRARWLLDPGIDAGTLTGKPGAGRGDRRTACWDMRTAF
jgi:hypothetical protein